MTDALDRAASLLEQAYETTLALVPDRAEIFDAHTHVGDDIDGFYSRRDGLLEFLDRAGASGAFTFCLDEPDREPCFTAANDRTMSDAAASDGRLLPFVRLDLEDHPVEEARRVLDIGARGIKLHPRAQRFSVGDDRLDPVFALSAEYGVPILIHAGRGMPKIADDLEALVSAHPRAPLIIAHGGVADLERLTGHLAGRAGVYFDTSVFNLIDLIDLFGRVAPEQILYASDYPYGQHPGSLYAVLRACGIMGFSEEQVRGIVGGNSRALADGTPPTPSSPLGQRQLETSATMLRIHTYLAMATPSLWLRHPDRIGVMGLAINTAQSNGRHAELLDDVREHLAVGRDLWHTASEMQEDDPDEAFKVARVAMKLLHIADVNVLSAGY